MDITVSQSGYSTMYYKMQQTCFPSSNVPIPYWGEIGMGFSSLSGEATKGGKKFLHESRKAHYIFPKNGLAGVVKKNSTMSGEATNGGIFFYHNC